MNKLEDFVKPTQNELFNMLLKKYRDVAIAHFGNYILIPGQAPIMLLAHMDTVHEKPVKHICKSPDGNILMSPQGIGGDDRCGVYALVKVHEASLIKPWLLFTCNEEIGGLGAEKFVMDYSDDGRLPKGKGRLPEDITKMKLLIEIDRKGKNDAVYYGCNNSEFEKYITSKGFITAYGSFSDISVIAPVMGVAAVNLSSGYYNQHTLHEYINCKQIGAVIKSVVEIVADAAKPDFPKYEYIKKVYKLTPSSKADVVEEYVPFDLPSDMVQMYSDLLELYTQNELELYRKEYGNQIITQLYNEEFSSFYDTDDVLNIIDGQFFE